jgi:hypothetical protein
MLEVSPKTLRQWLKHSHLSLHQSPKDARIKCLTLEQVQQLATSHDRSIEQDAISQREPLILVQPEKPTYLQPARGHDPDLVKSLSSLEATVANLQQQVAQLALQLVHERELRYERRLSTLEALMQPNLGLPPATKPSEISAPACPQDEGSLGQWRPNPAELRTRSGVIPLIEYAADGTYVIICPQEGELFFAPDSQEWFDWLASLSSFHFEGQLGRFHAYRESRRSGPRRTWKAVRGKRNRNYKCYLGVTDRLTISCLEQAAATLQSHVTAL